MKKKKTELENYDKIRDEIVKISEEYKLLQKSPIKLEDSYSGIVVITRSYRSYLYDRFVVCCLSKLIDMDENIMPSIFKTVDYLDFDVYAQDFVNKQIREYENLRMYSITINEIVVNIVKMIYHGTLQDTDIHIAQHISGILELDKNGYQNDIIKLIKGLLEEHVRRTNKIVKNTGYPISTVLQMMDYPAVDREEYDSCIKNMYLMLDEISLIVSKNL